MENDDWIRSVYTGCDARRVNNTCGAPVYVCADTRGYCSVDTCPKTKEVGE